MSAVLSLRANDGETHAHWHRYMPMHMCGDVMLSSAEKAGKKETQKLTSLATKNSLPNHPYVNKPILSGINERSLKTK